MRSLLKLSLASLAAVALFAGMAMAQDKPTLSLNLDLVGSLNMAGNSFSKDTAAGPPKVKTESSFSGFQTQWQADWNVNASLGQAGARSKIRFRDTGQAACGTGAAACPDTDRSELWYNFSDAFTLKWHIRSWGLPATLYGYSVYTGTTTTAGWPTDVAGPVAFFVNQSGLDATFKFGSNYAGVAVFDACVPACGYTAQKLSAFTVTSGTVAAGGAATGAPTSAGSKATQSIVPYFGGAFGPVSLGVFASSTSGLVTGQKSTATKTQDNDVPVSSTLLDVNGKVDLGAAQVGFEVASWSQSCDKKANGTTNKATTVSKCDAQTNTQEVVGARVNAGPGRVEVHYALQSTDNSFTLVAGNAKTSFHQDFSDIMLGYAIPMNASFTLVPVYEGRTTNEETKTGSTKLDQTLTNSLIGLAARGIF